MSRLYDAYNEAAFQAPEVLTPERLSQGIEKYRGYEPFLPGNRDASILDIGCGVGYFLHFLKSRGYSNIQGIDLSPQMIGICKANFPGVHAEVADAFDYLLSHQENFDAIVANDVLEHVPKDRTVDLMAAIRSALKKGGAFLAKVPNLGNPFAIRLRYTDFTHEVGFTEHSLWQVLWLGGFRTIRVLPFPLVHPLTLKSKLEGIISRVIFLWITKMMQYQGFVAPRILTPLIFVQAVKDRDAG
ncbi:MAG: class I SAM-dependent methyltransferase [Deltaproteobacteria bacterium]|nr:class I SAM-dependent methyltransferase [Deltaproteobacteria bacterium]